MSSLLSLLLAINIGSGSGTQYRQPQLAANDKMVVAVFGSGSTVYFSASYDQGRTFSAPVKVAEAPLLALGRHRGPRVAITPSAIVVSALVGTKTPPGSDGDLRAWRSTDGGRTWSAGVPMNDVPASAREGLHSMVAGPDGMLFATWLDLRQQGTRLYGATSKDGGVTWSKNVLVYESPSGTICQCCHPTAIFDTKGGIHVMWRNALDGNRDMYVAHSSDHGATFQSVQKLGVYSWKLEACPMDGGGLTFDRSGKLVSIWRRETDIYMAEAGASETKIENGKDAAIAAGSDGIYVVWTTAGAIHARVPSSPQPITLAEHGDFPQLVAIPNGPVLAAWEDGGQLFIQPVKK